MLERWHETPAPGDLREILEAFAIARKEAGGDLVVIEVISAGVRPPPAETVHEARHGIRRLRHLRCLHLVVIEGDSGTRAVVRGIFNTIAFVLGEAVVTCRTVEEAVARACEVTGQDPVALLREIGAAGLLEAS